MSTQAERERAKFASIQKRKNQNKASTFGVVRLYLFVYNVASFAGWAYVLYNLSQHLFPPSSPLSLNSFLPASKQHVALLSRATTAYAKVGDLTRTVQTFALLEVGHVALGMVRSGLGTTMAQVASRLFIVWGVLLWFPQVQSSPIFSSMVFAWCIAEMIRYPVYALAQMNIKLYSLDWLRYTLFYVLYPLGAGSEAYLIYSAIPWARQRYGRPGSVFMTIMLFFWPPALAAMMSHMHVQRKKFIGRSGPNPKKRV